MSTLAAQKRKQHLNEKKKLKKLKITTKKSDVDDYNDFYDNNADKLMDRENRLNTGNKSKSLSTTNNDIVTLDFTKKEHIKFGERVDRPPDLSNYSKQMNKTKERIEKNRLGKMQSMNYLVNEDEGTSNKEVGLQNSKNQIKKESKRKFDEMIGGAHSSDDYYSNSSRSHISQSSNNASIITNKEEMERLRLEVQLAYKAVKENRLENSKKSKV